ncbi:MAG: SprB repeat-containing protein [Flavobacteriales bacterium]|nr:SprB repeat-containing protein [Flavobacteriales bacterium]
MSASVSGSTDVLCFGNSSGSATVDVVGGTAPYLYSWNSSPVQTNETASDLPAGNFTASSDANGPR